MANRTVLFFTSAVLFAAATPVLAQDNRADNYPDAEEIEWQQYEVVQGLPEYETAADDEVAAPAMRDRHHRRGNSRRMQHTAHQQSAPRLAYSNEEREAWLADCRIVMRGDDYYDRDDARYDDDDDDDGNGGLLGGLFGTVAGGIAGNRIAGSGDRLTGTLIGAGVGGIAGAVIGDAIDGDDDNRRGYQYSDYRGEDDYCGAYLRRYEASGQTGASYGQPIMMIAAPAQRGAMREIIREEWADVADEPARPHQRFETPHQQSETPHPALDQGKRTRLR